MVQPTISVEERLNAAVAASEAEAAAKPAVSQSSGRTASTPVRAAARTETARPAAPQPVDRAEAVAPEPAPVAAPVTAAAVTGAPEAAPAAPAAVEAREAGVTDAGTDESLLWALGGGALLLAGLGGAALARRRRHRAEVEEDVFVTPAAPLIKEPAAVAPAFVAREPVAEPVVTRVPVAMPLAAGAAHGSSLEAMVAAPPSAENPFRTHRKRLARARFLLAQQEKREQTPYGDAPAHVPPQTIHAEPQMQTVYRMGADRNRRMTFKPQTR